MQDGVTLFLSKNEIQKLQNMLALFVPIGGGSEEMRLQMKISKQSKIGPSEDGPAAMYKSVIREALDDVEGNALEYMKNHISLLREIENDRRRELAKQLLPGSN